MEKTKTSLSTAKLQESVKLKQQSVKAMFDADFITDLFDFSSDEIIITDNAFNILARNFKVFAQKSDNVKNFMTLLDKRGLYEEKIFIEKYSKSKTRKTALRLVLPEGKYIKAKVARRYENNNVIGYLIVLNDYTEEIVRVREKEYFIDTLMHDLKTPARAEENALELLCTGALGGLNTEQRQMLKEILNSSRYMVRMTDNVLTKLKLETSGLVLKKQPNSLKRTIESCIDDMKYMFETANQTIKIELLTTDEIFVYDEETIKLVIKNLLTNASEYSPPYSIIYMTIQQNTEKITITVKDKGKGISREKAETLFNIPNAYNKRFKKVSSGLGLFISRKILEAHNGTINVQSSDTAGSQFVVTLPF